MVHETKRAWERLHLDEEASEMDVHGLEQFVPGEWDAGESDEGVCGIVRGAAHQLCLYLDERGGQRAERVYERGKGEARGHACQVRE